MHLREQWNNFKKNVKELKKEDLQKLLPKVRADFDAARGYFLLLFQEHLTPQIIEETLVHMCMTGQVHPVDVYAFTSTKKLSQQTYSKIRNYRKNGYHLLDPKTVPINTRIHEEIPKATVVLTDVIPFQHKEASRKTALLQTLYGNSHNRYGAFSLEDKIKIINKQLDVLINDEYYYDDKPELKKRVMSSLKRDIELVTGVCEANGFYLECRGDYLVLYKDNTVTGIQE